MVQQGGNREIPSGLIRIADPAERSEQEARAFAEDVGSVGRTLSRVSEPQLNRTSLCEIAADAIAWGVNSALVAAIATGCAAGTVVTVGGLAIPCTALVVGAAGVGAVNSVMWAAILKDAMCGIPVTAHTPPQASAEPAGVPSVDGTSLQPLDTMAG